jgi:putative ABC transport system substrate-binding protein
LSDGSRAFISAITIGLLAAPVAGGAQPAAKLWRIGYLDQGSEANNRLYVDGLRQGLGDLGWVEGRTMVIESRFAEGKTDQLPRLAAELVRSKVG